MKKTIFSVLVVNILIFNLAAQNIPVLITGRYDHVTLKSFIAAIEQKYNFVIYFEESSIGNTIVTAEFAGVALDKCMTTILENTGLSFEMMGSDRAVIYTGPALSEIFGGSYKTPEIKPETESRNKLSSEKLQQLQYQMINIGTPGLAKSRTATISGHLRNFETGDPVAGGNVYVSNIQKGSTSDANGFFKITLPTGNQVVNFTYIGMQPVTRNVNLYSDGELDVDLELKLNLLEGAVIVGQGEGKVGKMHIGMEKIEVLTIKSIPTLLGESDVVKSVLILPGVTSVGEGTAGFNVRGGNTDQNLILIDRATIYYPSHFFGNFSAVNSEIIESATLYKGSIPARYGGRISSVFEINTTDGGHERLSGSAGISPIYARFNLGGPLLSEKSTFLTSIRSTYSDWLLSRLNVPELYNSKAGFYDIQAKLNLYINEKNNLLINFYHSSDRFQLHSDTSYKYRNTIGSLILKHKYGHALTSSTSLICSIFDYEISNVNSTDQSFTLTHKLTNLSLINDFEHSSGKGIRYNFGVELNFYSINPGERRVPEDSNISQVFASDEHALEYGIYGGTEYNISGNLKMEAGIRLSGLLSSDDGKQYIYGADGPYEEENITDTLFLSKNSVQKGYMHPEWRLSLSYSAGTNSSIKFSYNKTAQYIHMISNTTAISPTDTWKLSDVYVLPETGDQVSAGFFRNFGSKRIEASAEVFYKWVNNIKQYKPGADLLLNDHIETEIVNAHGKSYGLELSLEKSGGRIYGRIDYTYSRTLLKSVSGFKEELINDGEYFPANWDKPHNLNLLASLKMSRRLIFSTGIYYSTGRPVTYPVSKYMLGDQVFLQYSDYNQYRLSDYFRTDLSVTYSGNLKKDKAVHSSLTLSLYNVTSRKNAYSVYYKSEGGQYRAYQLSIFGTIIPTLTYNINF
jgi:hypothetical protein